MPTVEQMGRDNAADIAGTAGDEYAHSEIPYLLEGRDERDGEDGARFPEVAV
jgi:hypothetical protein